MVVDASDHWSECSFGLFEALNHLYGASRSSPLATPTEGPGDLCGWVLVFPESFQIVLSEVGLYRQKRNATIRKTRVKYEHKLVLPFCI